MITPFNATVATTFFGFHRTNVNFELTNKTIHDRHVISVAGDIVHFNLSGCDRPDRNLSAIINYSAVAMVCLVAFLFQLSLFSVFWKMTKTHGPSFYPLLTLLLCSCLNIILWEFLLYFEAAIGFRLPIPLDLDYYIKMPFGRGEAVFYFLYAINRSACLLYPFNYDTWFSSRNVKWAIFGGWIYTLLENSERLLANKGMNRVQCLGSGDQLDDFVETYCVIKDPLMVIAEVTSACIYYVIWYGPAVLDFVTMAKLFYDKYTIRATPPWLVARPVYADQISVSRSERLRIFFVCFCTSSYHFLFASAFAYIFTTLFGYDLARKTRPFYNPIYILENSFPYLLMLFICREVRSGWFRQCKAVLERRSGTGIGTSGGGQNRRKCAHCWRPSNVNRVNPQNNIIIPN